MGLDYTKLDTYSVPELLQEVAENQGYLQNTIRQIAPDNAAAQDWIGHYCGNMSALFQMLSQQWAYDFEKWARDLGEKSTPQARALAKTVLEALDKLAGAY